VNPYWTSKDGRHVLYNADCMDVLPTLVGVDAVVTDPPWGVNNNNANDSRGRGHRPYDANCGARDFAPVIGDDNEFDPSPFLSICENVCLWGANHFSDKLPNSPFWLVWDRKADKAAKSDITDCELAWTRGTHYRTVRKFSHMWAGFQRDSQAGEQHVHPMEKPVALMQWSIGWFGATTILDPFTGSGTAGVACIRTGRKFIGIEISREYCDIAIRRMERELSQPKLPGMEPERITQLSLLEAVQ